MAEADANWGEPELPRTSPGAARIIRRIVNEKRAGAPDELIAKYAITEALHLITGHDGTAADCTPCHEAMNRVVDDVRTPRPFDMTGAAIVVPEAVEISYMAGVSDEEVRWAREAALETALALYDEQQEPPGRVPTVTVGQEFTPEHRYVLRAYRAAHGKPTVGTGMPTAAEVNQAADWWNQRVAVTSDPAPVGASPYPDPIPREDQDYDGARRPHGPRHGLPAQAVRPADETGHDAEP